MAGISTSQRTLAAAFGDRARADRRTCFALAPGVDPDATAQALESAFLANGMRGGRRCEETLDDAVAAHR